MMWDILEVCTWTEIFTACGSELKLFSVAGSCFKGLPVSSNGVAVMADSE